MPKLGQHVSLLTAMIINFIDSKSELRKPHLRRF